MFCFFGDSFVTVERLKRHNSPDGGRIKPQGERSQQAETRKWNTEVECNSFYLHKNSDVWRNAERSAEIRRRSFSPGALEGGMAIWWKQGGQVRVTLITSIATHVLDRQNVKRGHEEQQMWTAVTAFLDCDRQSAWIGRAAAPLGGGICELCAAQSGRLLGISPDLHLKLNHDCRATEMIPNQSQIFRATQRKNKQTNKQNQTFCFTTGTTVNKFTN